MQKNLSIENLLDEYFKALNKTITRMYQRKFGNTILEDTK